jgi:hypothetical protein
MKYIFHMSVQIVVEIYFCPLNLLRVTLEMSAQTAVRGLRSSFKVPWFLANFNYEEESVNRSQMEVKQL